jgi:caffeoyl-CoA O-methyltransferase
LESEFIRDDVEQFAYDHTKPESDIFRRLRDETYRDMEYAQMQVGRMEGQFLKMLVRLSGAGRILEIGRFTGYS